MTVDDLDCTPPLRRKGNPEEFPLDAYILDVAVH
jgi:hypothetical protein